MASKKTPPQAWFRNPTEEAAIRMSERKERQAAKKTVPPKIYICSPYKGDTEKNTANAIGFCRFAVEHSYFPICPHVYLPRFMDENNPAERELALSFGIRLLQGCKEIWVFGSIISEGMRQEIMTANRYGIKIRRFNERLQEVKFNAT